MKFFADITAQNYKHGQRICGDAFACERDERGVVFIICDGIGSGMYANIAAISCVSRLKELLSRGVSLRAAAEMVAASMHKAREAEIPFAAFCAAAISPDGHYSVYTYESPAPIRIADGVAEALAPEFYTAGYEVVGEASGLLENGDGLLLFSDGVSQAGLGHGYAWGIGPDGVAAFVNKELAAGCQAAELPAAINTIAHSTDAAKAIGKVVPSVNGKLQGHAQRIQVPDGSVTELTTVLNKEVTADEINAAFKAAFSSTEFYGYNEDGIVSSDIIGDTHGGVFDPTQTDVNTVDGVTMARTVSWYDNEYGFTCNMVRTLLYFAEISE